MQRIQSKLIVDARESRRVKDALVALGCEFVEKLITPGDYVVSDECAVERKGFHDFLASVYDGRLFDQAERLARVYAKPVLIVEGERNLEAVSNPAVFWGALTKIMADHNVSVLFTSDCQETAMFLCSLSRKIQEKKNEEKRRRILSKHKPKFYTLSQRQLFTVQTLPNIGPTRAERLLQHFGSVRRVFNASNREIQSIEGLGAKTVQEIRKLLDTKYPGLEEP